MIGKKIFFILNLLYFILSSFAWPTSFIPDVAVLALGLAIYLGFFLFNEIKIKLDTSTITIFIAFMAYAAYNVMIGSYTVSLKYIPAILLCFLSASLKRELLSFITKWYSILISMSLVVYALSFSVQLPSFGMVNHYIYEPYINYLIYIKSTSILQELRFNGFFFEPGHCAVIGAILLFANRYKFRNNRYLIPILISILFSLSLAGYLLIFLGLLLLNITKIKIILSIAMVIFLGYIFVAFIWEDGENPVNELIVARLEYSERDGIKGNNRVYKDTDRVFKNAIETNQIWTGLGMNRFNELFNRTIAGSGYKIFLLQYGIIGMLLVFFMYYSYSLTAINENRKFAALFLLFMGIIFLQRCYPFWFSWQIPFICSMVKGSNFINNNKVLVYK